MSDPYEQDRDRYYRAFYQQGGTVIPPTAEAVARARVNYERVLNELRRDTTRIHPFTPMTTEQQSTYLLNRFGTMRPQGIGVRQGEYITLRADQTDDSSRFLATDFLMDCQAMVLVARDAQGNVTQTMLSHIDALTDVPTVVPNLLQQFPADARIEATLIGNPVGNNYYLQADLLRTLAGSPQVTSIRDGFDAATTVAVDTKTGLVLTAATPESEATAYNITEIPIGVTFSPRTPETTEIGMNPRYISSQYATRAPTTRPGLGLFQSYRAGEGFTTFDTDGQFVLERQRSGGVITRDELREIAGEIGRMLRTPVQLEYSTEPNGSIRVGVETTSGLGAGYFFVTRIDPTLGSSGTVREH